MRRIFRRKKSHVCYLSSPTPIVWLLLFSTNTKTFRRHVDIYGIINGRKGRKTSTMVNFDTNPMNLFTLPDEMLCAILNKLSMVDVFYSLVGVNERFDRLALDSLYIHHLYLVVKPIVRRYSSSTGDQVLDNICKTILPQICNDVYKLTVELLSLELVLGIAHYPHLHSLSFSRKTFITIDR